jgi:hypothetical protein
VCSLVKGAVFAWWVNEDYSTALDDYGVKPVADKLLHCSFLNWKFDSDSVVGFRCADIYVTALPLQLAGFTVDYADYFLAFFFYPLWDSYKQIFAGLFYL